MPQADARAAAGQASARATPALLSAPDRLAVALARLEASRLALRNEMIPPPPSTGAQTGAGGASPWRARWRQLRRQARRWPVAALVTDAVQRWWQAHPWRDTGEVVAYGLQARLLPVLRRHPLAAVAGAAALGALVVVGRPWRWPLVGNQLRPLPNRMGRWLIHQLTTVPMQTALASLLVMGISQFDDKPAPDAGDQPADAAPDAAAPHPGEFHGVPDPRP